MSAGWADAVVSPPTIVSTRNATKAVVLHGPAIMILPCDICLIGEEQYTAGNMAKSSPSRTVKKKPAWGLFFSLPHPWGRKPLSRFDPRAGLVSARVL